MKTIDRLWLRMVLDWMWICTYAKKYSRYIIRGVLLLGATFLVCVLFMFDW